MGIARLALISFILVTVPLSAQEVAPPQEKPAQTEREPGLYITFETSKGSITCWLFEKEAPNTVRTFVGLALGTKSYKDPTTGDTISGKRFYDGSRFHRVIPEYMIQGGGISTSVGMVNPAPGLGFPFKDEFSPDLTFSMAGRLAMANAGPNTNGTQFFITEVEAPHLDPCLEAEGCERGDQKVKKGYGHTIFGQCGSPDVVQAIARVPTDSRQRPRTPVVINRVSVERVGPAPENPPEALPAPPKAPAKGPAKAPAKKAP